MKFIYVTDEDSKRALAEEILNIKEDDKSEFVFNNEYLYKAGRGHAFGFGFYGRYLTKSGIVAIQYQRSDFWHIGQNRYTYDGGTNQFTEIIIEPYVQGSIDYFNISFPVVKNVNAKTIADSITPIKPK